MLGNLPQSASKPALKGYHASAVTGVYQAEVMKLMGMEHNPRSLVALTGMRILAFWAMIKTLFWATLSFIVVLIVHLNIKKAIKAFVIRWYMGPVFASSCLFDAFSPTLRSIRKGAPGFQALHHIYNWNSDRHDKTVNLDSKFYHKALGYPLAKWWIGMNNAQAVRNRHLLVVKLLTIHFKNYVLNHPNSTYHLLSVACGSAQPVMKALKACKSFFLEHSVFVEVRLLDKDPKPIKHAKMLEKKFNLGAWVSFKYFETSATNAREVCDNGHWVPDMIEMIGLMDYFGTTKGKEIVKLLHSLLASGGVYLTGHILDNPEAFVLRWLIAWAMLYRTPQDVGDIVASAFGEDNVRLYLEPFLIHVVVEGIKTFTHNDGGDPLAKPDEQIRNAA